MMLKHTKYSGRFTVLCTVGTYLSIVAYIIYVEGRKCENLWRLVLTFWVVLLSCSKYGGLVDIFTQVFLITVSSWLSTIGSHSWWSFGRGALYPVLRLFLFFFGINSLGVSEKKEYIIFMGMCSWGMIEEWVYTIFASSISQPIS